VEQASGKDRTATFARWLTERPHLTETCFTSLTVLFGIQLLKVLVPGMFWILGDRMGLGAVHLGAIGLVIFLCAFLVIPLERWFGKWRLVIVTAAGLGLIRLYIQLWWGEPLLNLSLAAIGTMVFLIFLIAWLKSASRISYMVLGLLGGLLLDTAINGAFNTYDPIWQVKLAPILLTTVLVMLQVLLLFGIAPHGRITVTSKANRFGDKAAIKSPLQSYSLLAIGPFLFLEMVVLQNIPRLAAITNWQLPAAFAVVLIAQLVGLVAATWLLNKFQTISWPWGLGTGVILVAALIFAQQKAPLPAALLLVLSQVLVSTLIAIIIVRGIQGNNTVSIASAISMLLLLVFLFAYYAVYDMKLPYSNSILEPVAGAIMLICATIALLRERKRLETDRRLWVATASAFCLLLLPLANFLTWQQPVPVQGKGYPLRVMTYNLHNGFNTKGHLDMEELARVIENNNPDVVALQEVSRGWVVSGRVDMLAWLSHRLKMPYIFGPTADPLWGNAILSRYPVLAYSRHVLPPSDLFIERGFIVALIDLGNGDAVKVIATHFHHLKHDTAIRQTQSQVILNFWSGLDHTVIMGDFNGEPDSSEIIAFRRAGLTDTAKVMYSNPPFTYSSDNPVRRIDYIWTSSDLNVLDVVVPMSTASDHLPVVATVTKEIIWR